MTTCGSSYSDIVASLILEVGAACVSVEKPFTLASGKLSPVYFDCRRLLSSSSAMRIVADLFAKIIERNNINVEVIAGGESAGIPFAAYLACLMNMPMVYVRKAPKGHGTGSQVEGAYSAGMKTILVEDLITDAASKMVFVSGIRHAGLEISDCFVVLDREQGGEEALANEGVRLWALTTAKFVLDYAAQNDALGRTDYESAMLYLENPSKWEGKR